MYVLIGQFAVNEMYSFFLTTTVGTISLNLKWLYIYIHILWHFYIPALKNRGGILFSVQNKYFCHFYLGNYW